MPEESRFNARNENGTLLTANSLFDKNLLDFDTMAWHYTLKLTKLGETVVEQC